MKPYEKVTVWCYSCGEQWEHQPSDALWDWFTRCPSCGGYTDGVTETAIKRREII
jgi:Zn finger protein HypA/HybF involved in hydrogenase expression